MYKYTGGWCLPAEGRTQVQIYRSSPCHLPPAVSPIRAQGRLGKIWRASSSCDCAAPSPPLPALLQPLHPFQLLANFARNRLETQPQAQRSKFGRYLFRQSPHCFPPFFSSVKVSMQSHSAIPREHRLSKIAPGWQLNPLISKNPHQAVELQCCNCLRRWLVVGESHPQLLGKRKLIYSSPCP